MSHQKINVPCLMMPHLTTLCVYLLILISFGCDSTQNTSSPNLISGGIQENPDLNQSEPDRDMMSDEANVVVPADRTALPLKPRLFRLTQVQYKQCIQSIFGSNLSLRFSLEPKAGPLAHA